MNKKDRILAFLSGIGLTGAGLSSVSLGFYSVGIALGSEWLLKHYFMAVFGTAGVLIGLIFSLAGLIFIEESFFPGNDGDEE